MIYGGRFLDASKVLQIYSPNIPIVNMITPKLNKLNMKSVVQPLTSIKPANLQITSATAHITEPIKEQNPINVTAFTGSVEILNKVSATSLIFFFRVHLLSPISRAIRV